MSNMSVLLEEKHLLVSRIEQLDKEYKECWDSILYLLEMRYRLGPNVLLNSTKDAFIFIEKNNSVKEKLSICCLLYQNLGYWFKTDHYQANTLKKTISEWSLSEFTLLSPIIHTLCNQVEVDLAFYLPRYERKKQKLMSLEKRPLPRLVGGHSYPRYQ